MLFDNEIKNFQDPVPLKVSSRACEPGESYGEALTCLPCEIGYRLYEK